MSILVDTVDAALSERQRRADKDRYFHDPVLWAKDIVGVDLWSKQGEISDSLRYNKNIAVKAAHGVGKSFLVAVLACWWVDTRYPDAFVASTAPSTAQIGAIVWREIRSIYKIVKDRYDAGVIDHKLPGVINRDNKNNEWKDRDGTLIGFGRKPPDGKEDDNFQGIHDGYVLAIGDEAVGLSKKMITSLRNITSNEDSRVILIANPTNPASYMAEIFKKNGEEADGEELLSTWALHTISVFDSPNFTGEKDKIPEQVLKKLTGPQYVADMRHDHGEDDPMYISRVLGEFAFDRGNALIKYDDVAKAWDTEIVPSMETQPDMGVDVARYGQDLSVAYLNHDNQVRFLKSWGHSSGTDTAREIHKLALDHAVRAVKIDGTGLGGPIVDMVAEMAEDKYTVVDLMPAGASPDKKRWHNVRAYWWDEFKRMLHRGEIDLDHEDDTLGTELMTPEYKFSNFNALLIESKDEMRKRNVKSPDFADAAIYSVVDVASLIEDPLSELEPGDRIGFDFNDDWQRDFLPDW